MIPPNTTPQLAPHLLPLDFTSATWLALAEHMRARIDQLRVRNDSDLDEGSTLLLRGQIRAFKELLGLPEAVARVRSGLPPGPGA